MNNHNILENGTLLEINKVDTTVFSNVKNYCTNLLCTKTKLNL